VRIKRRKKLASGTRVKSPCASRVNERWTMDFVSDELADGRRIPVLTVIDSFTRECLTMKVAQTLPAAAVTDAPEEVIGQRGAPEAIQVDNGSESTPDRAPSRHGPEPGVGPRSARNRARRARGRVIET
jgi:putative transposase